MLPFRRLHTCQVRASPQPEEWGPLRPAAARETAGISETDGPQFPAPASSSIIYKEDDVAPWNLIHNAFLMPFEHNAHTVPV